MRLKDESLEGRRNARSSSLLSVLFPELVDLLTRERKAGGMALFLLLDMTLVSSGWCLMEAFCMLGLPTCVDFRGTVPSLSRQKKKIVP